MARALPGIVLGVGLGAFLDGIVLHQLLQWHHLVSSVETDETVAGLETNTFWDGVFHLAAWLVTVVGVVLVLRAWRSERAAWPPARLLGLALTGWGLFNVADQLLFHLPGAHQIREGENYQLYDWGFFALGVLLIAVGAALARRGGATSRGVPRARGRA